MAASVEAHAWDGAWFLRAWDHAGQPIGSHRNAEAQIFLEPQALCAMAGIGVESGHADRAMQSVAERLAGPRGVALLDPPFQAYRAELGEISTYLPGYKENGSVFCHTNLWVVIAEAQRGRADRAMLYLQAIAPPWQEDHDTRRTEPYVYAQMVAGPGTARPGEAKNSWLTGTASWSHVAVTQYILGIRASLDGLVVDPRIPADWPSFQARRVFRGATYEIEVVNARSAGRGAVGLTVDGKPVLGRTVPLAEPGATVRVKLVLG
jgi:cellobiose phosphorylase